MANKIKHGEEAVKRGLEVIDQVYGPGYHKTMEPMTDFPYVNETVGNLFADVWNRPGLSIRDRRLLVIGATCMLGRADLIETQVTGAILNGELNDEELEEIALQMAFYTGWGNTSATWRGIQMAKKAAAEWNKKGDA